MKKHVGFTLIELLVVILIIGVLAAIALPQYQKAIWKARSTQLLTYVRHLGETQEDYYLRNSNYATSYAQLEVDFPSLPSKDSFWMFGTSSTDAFRGDDNMVVVVNNSNQFRLSSGMLKKGPYAYGGFVVLHYMDAKWYHGKLMCIETSNIEAGKFCHKLWHTAAQPAFVAHGLRFYAMN